INPHWTGRHCAECHVEGKVPELKFMGDTIQICNRCHSKGSPAGAEPHPVAILMPDAMKKIMPGDWPLKDGRVTCLTCHDARSQMYENIPLQTENKNFLRGTPAGDSTGFCVNCHQKALFQKPNPHKQLDAQGAVDRDSCMFCHKATPDAARVKEPGEAPLKAGPSALCTGCHGAQKKAHPGRADHLVAMPEAMRQAAALQAKAQGVALPLENDAIMCSTCHNPHQKGIIQRAAAASGAGEKKFLRLPGGYDICVACHADKAISQKSRGAAYEKNPLKTPPGMLTFHKPWTENKCKACHSITASNPGKPPSLFLCLKQGCHDAALINREHKHSLTLLRNCGFCHENHSSEHIKLLKSNEEPICFTCHPLLHDKGKGFPAAMKEAKDVHASLVSSMMSLGIEQGSECFYCHSPEHSARITTLPTNLCADCHITARNILLKAASGGLTAHERFKDKKCTVCHDPHAGAYQYQLKEPAATYK
ncbi:MAG: cytochrome c3 family protein, partial [Pseudomonadota bacterium]